MLSEITIQNFAIIENLHLNFEPGFNVLTGETGAGKSIILDAVTLLLGARADQGVVRAGASHAIVEAGFDLAQHAEAWERISAILTREALESDAPADPTLIISREIKESGRSIARVNGHTTNMTILQEIGEHLIDIHGQGDHLSLLKPTAHLDLLDRYGGLLPDRRAFAATVREVEKLRATLYDLIHNEEALRQRAERLAETIHEISILELKLGEDIALVEESRRLANAEQLAELTREAFVALYGASEDGAGGVLELLGLTVGALGRLVKIDPTLDEPLHQAESLAEQAGELLRAVEAYQEELEADPLRLNEIELRLDRINYLKRRYACDTVEALLALAQEAADELTRIERGGEQIAELQDEEARLLLEVGEMGAALTEARQAAAGQLSQAVEQELAHLRMENARFQVAITQREAADGAPVGEYRLAFDRTGLDKIEFMLAPNLGEPLKPLIKVASGGETSRIMLALKTVLSRADSIPTLIFDEIDTGIGGRIGAVVGEKLWSLSSDHQVLVVTHLPQLAGFGDVHFKVQKGLKNQRTITEVFPLAQPDRIDELSAMLGAETEASRTSAQELLTYVERVKRGEVPARS